MVEVRDGGVWHIVKTKKAGVKAPAFVCATVMSFSLHS